MSNAACRTSNLRVVVLLGLMMIGLLASTTPSASAQTLDSRGASVARSLNRDGPVKVVGRGQAGILGAYAALFEPSIREVVAIDPPISHAGGPIFLNVLRVLDIPQALELLAPRPLTLISAGDPAFQHTEEIYRRAGAEHNLRRN